VDKGTNDIAGDEALLEGLRSGDGMAIHRLYGLYFPSVSKMVVNNGGCYEEAQDIFQETVLVLYDKANRGDFRLSSRLGTFLYAVSKRLWLKQLTRGESKYGKDRIADHEDLLAAEEAIEEHKALEGKLLHMEKSLESLGEPCKTILQDFYIHNRSMADICEKFGYTNTDNAKTQKYKCLQRLKKMFFKKGGPERS